MTLVSIPVDFIILAAIVEGGNLHTNETANIIINYFN